MNRFVPLLCCIAIVLAGCTSSNSPESSSTSHSQSSSTMPPATNTTAASTKPVVVPKPVPIYINGTVTSAGGCPLNQTTAPTTIPGDTQPVPSLAVGRNYTGPNFSNPVNNNPTSVGAICAVWLDTSGTILTATPGVVPLKATQVLVRAVADYGVQYYIKIT